MMRSRVRLTGALRFVACSRILIKHLDIIAQFPEDLQPPILALMEELEEEADYTPLMDRMRRIENAIERQAEHIALSAAAQPRSDDRLEKLIGAVAGLTQAQANTENRLDEFAQAQARTDQRLEALTGVVSGLAQAQAKTEKTLAALIVGVGGLAKGRRQTRQKQGELARFFTHSLEDQAIKALPGLLGHDYDIKVTGTLTRDYLEVLPRRLIAMNIWGAGLKDGRPVEIVGRAKSRLSQKHVDRFVQQIEFIRRFLGKEIAPVIISHLATPELRRYMAERGVIFYASFQL